MTKVSFEKIKTTFKEQGEIVKYFLRIVLFTNSDSFFKAYSILYIYHRLSPIVNIASSVLTASRLDDDVICNNEHDERSNDHHHKVLQACRYPQWA